MGGTGHAHFFIDREDQAQRPMNDGLLNKEEGNSNGHAVVSAQAGAIGRQDIAIPFEDDFIRKGIIGTIRFCYTDHIHMALKHRHGSCFIARCCRNIGNDIIDAILLGRNA